VDRTAWVVARTVDLSSDHILSALFRLGQGELLHDDSPRSKPVAQALQSYAEELEAGARRQMDVLGRVASALIQEDSAASADEKARASKAIHELIRVRTAEVETWGDAARRALSDAQVPPPENVDLPLAPLFASQVVWKHDQKHNVGAGQFNCRKVEIKDDAGNTSVFVQPAHKDAFKPPPFKLEPATPGKVGGITITAYDSASVLVNVPVTPKDNFSGYMKLFDVAGVGADCKVAVRQVRYAKQWVFEPKEKKWKAVDGQDGTPQPDPKGGKEAKKVNGSHVSADFPNTAQGLPVDAYVYRHDFFRTWFVLQCKDKADTILGYIEWGYTVCLCAGADGTFSAVAPADVPKPVPEKVPDALPTTTPVKWVADADAGKDAKDDYKKAFP
jgi:hypothetical protein